MHASLRTNTRALAEIKACLGVDGIEQPLPHGLVVFVHRQLEHVEAGASRRQAVFVPAAVDAYIRLKVGEAEQRCARRAGDKLHQGLHIFLVKGPYHSPEAQYVFMLWVVLAKIMGVGLKIIQVNVARGPADQHLQLSCVKHADPGWRNDAEEPSLECLQRMRARV